MTLVDPPLDRIRVVDFGQYIAGPMAGMLMADQGAEVIRVDPPGGPAWSTPANRVWNRGKRGVTLDLDAAADRAVARELVLSADVVIENFRPGVMARLDLGPEDLLAANPRLVYLSLPGFAHDDPRAAQPGWEGVIGAATATYLARAAGETGSPTYTAVPISSAYAAVLGASSVAAALVARDRDGLGQWVEVPLFDATFSALGYVGLKYHNPSRAPMRGGLGWVRQYRCEDGRWVQFHAANTRFRQQFMDAAGVSWWADDGLLDRKRLLEEPELGTLLVERMTALFETRPAQEWEDLVNAAGTPTAVCREAAEWIEHPHAHASKMVVPVEDPVFGPMLQPGPTPRLESTVLDPQPAPVPGAQPRTANWSRPAQPVAQVESQSPWPTNGGEAAVGPLAGVKVLDLCIILAGPTCGRTLAEFGADVIKIDAPDREGGISFHEDINRGKRSIMLDLRQRDGLDVFWRLVDQADVVVQNYRAGVVERLGISYADVKRRKPDIVYTSLNAFGHDGPWEPRPGWEQVAQAATGMQARFGGDGPPKLQPFPANDYGTGLLGAYGVLLALHQRNRTGQGQHVRSALAYTALTLQSEFFMDYAGKVWDEPRGPEAVGRSPLQRMYHAADGWFFLGARREDLAELAGVAGLEGLDRVPRGWLEAELSERFGREPVATWVARLVDAGIGAHAVLAVDDVMDDPWAIQHGLSVTREYDGVGMVRHNGPGQRLYRTPAVVGKTTSVPGADAESVLTDVGLGDRYTDFRESGVVVIQDATMVG